VVGQPNEVEEAEEPVELLADADRPGGWLLLIDRIRQSYVDLDDPTYLDFEYVQALAEIIDTLPEGPLAVTHVGGGACTLARYIAHTRPHSSQIVLEPDERVTALVRARLPFARSARIRIRPIDGRRGLAQLKDASADVVVIDAFAGGRVPAELTTTECIAEVARVLKPAGVLLINAADGNQLMYTRRLVRTLRQTLPQTLIRADASVLKRRRFGNIVFAASAVELPVAQIERDAASAMFPQRVLAGEDLGDLVADAAPLTDAASLRSPEPPDELWRVS
jgi:spermidine synthase